MLLTDASGLTSRQAAGRLRDLGCSVGVLSTSRIALTRWTSAVERLHLVPPLGRDPDAWWRAARSVIERHGYDVVLPTQEQVVALAHAVSLGELPQGVVTAVPDFATLALVQDKVSAARTLRSLGVPQPTSAELTSASDLSAWTRYPAYVKTPIGTASAGVRRVEGLRDLATALEAPAFRASMKADGVLVQEACEGPLVMVQAVADHGRMVAFHANLRVVEGPGGGAVCKESMRVPALRAHVERMLRDLRWHGALSLDAVLGAEPVVIDVNPRLVEPGNALRSGVDLVGALLGVALEAHPDAVPDGDEAVRTHQLLLGLLAAARSGGRTAVWREALDAARGSGRYRGSSEELTPLHGDALAVVPLAAALGLATVRPQWAELLVASSTTAYAATAEAWASLVRRA